MIVLILLITQLPPVLAQKAVATDATEVSRTALDLGDGTAKSNPTEHISYYLDPTRSLSIEQIPGYEAQFRPTQRRELQFGYVDDAIWVRLPVFNSGSEPQVRYLLLETNWMETMRVWISKGADSQLILDQDQHMSFETREIPHRNLVTRFTLDAGQMATLWIRYSSRGSSALPINVETELSFIERSQARVSKSMIFYALMLLFITVAALSYILFRYTVFPIYVCYATTVLLYVMHRDGFAFQHLWPSLPNFNSFASLPLGAGLGLFAILFSRQYLMTAANYPKMDRLLMSCMLGLALLVPYGLFIDEQGAKQIASLSVFLVAVILLGLGIRSWIDRGRQMAFFVAGWLGVVGASLIMILGGVFGAEISREATLDSIRLAMVFDAMMMGFAMAERVLQIRRERDLALHRQLDAMRSNLVMHERLNKLERRYADAVQLAKSSGEVLADATHDIRQPLFALRASLKSITAGGSSEHLASATRTLVYLEQLVDEYLEKATGESAGGRPDTSYESGVPVGLVLTAIVDMFASDAQHRGLKLKVRPSPVLMTTNPMVVTRIVSNYVANALTYTRKGGVLVGVRKIKGCDFVVVYDTGTGMDEATLARVVRRAERGVSDTSGGKGLGLHIALSLAGRHGLATIANSTPGRGSLFAVAI